MFRTQALRTRHVSIRAVHRRLLRAGSDQGSSLTELLVGMTLMVIFMSMFTGAVIMMNRSVTKTEAVTDSAGQLNRAFLTLDRLVRYATVIGEPAQGSPTTWFVEVRTTTATGTEVCTQLRLSPQKLEQRSWQLNVPPEKPFKWLAVASGITNAGAAQGSSDQPFVPQPDARVVDYQQLEIRLVSSSGSGPTQTTSRSTVAFTALNSTMPAADPGCVKTLDDRPLP